MMDGIFGYTSTNAVNGVTTQDFDLDDCVRVMREFKRANRERIEKTKSELRGCICPECRRCVGYEVNPERFVMCSHLHDRMRDSCKDKTFCAPPIETWPRSIYGIQIEVSPLAPQSMWVDE